MLASEQYLHFAAHIKISSMDGSGAIDEERAGARGETNISRKLTNPHRALRTTRQS